MKQIPQATKSAVNNAICDIINRSDLPMVSSVMLEGVGMNFDFKPSVLEGELSGFSVRGFGLGYKSNQNQLIVNFYSTDNHSVGEYDLFIAVVEILPEIAKNLKKTIKNKVPYLANNLSLKPYDWSDHSFGAFKRILPMYVLEEAGKR
jgi:hypothetical protein